MSIMDNMATNATQPHITMNDPHISASMPKCAQTLLNNVNSFICLIVGWSIVRAVYTHVQVLVVSYVLN